MATIRNNATHHAMTTYRMLADGEQEWSGRASDSAHAEEKCFYDESPGSLVRYTLQRWGKVKISSTMSHPGWVDVYKNQSLA